MHAIPRGISTDEWAMVSINENNDTLVEISEREPQGVFVKPVYFEEGISGAVNGIYLRDPLVKMLLKASKNLPHGLNLMVLDGWRPLSVQLCLFKRVVNEIALRSPELGENEILKEAAKYASPGVTDERFPSPHFTGGAIDLTLVDSKGNELFMGTDHDDSSEKSSTRYFETLIEAGIELSDQQTEACRNRRLLYHAMVDAGFSNYEHEWWHFDYGNQFWAVRKQVQALYGLIELDGSAKEIGADM